MDHQLWIPLLALGAAMILCERRWCLLRDLTKPKPQPYSWSRVQLAWWTMIVLSSFIAIMWKGHLVNGVREHDAPQLWESAVILLGISSLTTITARTMDASVTGVTLPGDHAENFFLDILSDHNGVSISRFQTVIFNVVFGIWYLYKVAVNLAPAEMADINKVMPDISPNNLVLLGLSSAAYTAMKFTENKEKEKMVTEETGVNNSTNAVDEIEPAVG
jgi:hypothetical protein